MDYFFKKGKFQQYVFSIIFLGEVFIVFAKFPFFILFFLIPLGLFTEKPVLINEDSMGLFKTINLNFLTVLFLKRK